MTSLQQLDKLLDSRLERELAAISKTEEIVGNYLLLNASNFNTFVTEKKIETEGDVRKYFEREILRMDASLPVWDLTSISDMRDAAAQIANHASRKGVDGGIFIKQSTARDLLIKNQPVNLISNMGVDSLEEAFRVFSPLECIALSRHSESNSWQFSHLQALSHLQRDAFETRAVQYLVLDSTIYARMLRAGGHSAKPWSMSHSKETGIISCFTNQTSMPAPRLLFAALFLHYFEEITRAGQSIAKPPRRSLGPGHHVAAIIRSTQRKLPFFSTNYHSEALYWENGIKNLAVLYPQLGIECYVPLLSCGDFFSENTPSSLNIIDRLWDINFSDQGHDYFAANPGRFLYHFREALWSELLGTLRNIQKDDMAHAVFSSLDLDDVQLTRAMIGKIGTNPSFKARILRRVARSLRPLRYFFERI